MKGYLMILGAGTLWGSLGIFGRALYADGMTPLGVVIARATVAAAIFTVWTGVKQPKLLRIDPRDLGFFALYGLIGIGIFYFLLFYSISRTSVATAVTLMYTAPAYVSLLSSYLFGERLTGAKVGALALTFAGVALVSGGYDPAQFRGSLPGILSGLGAGLTYGLYSIFGKKAAAKYHQNTVLVYSFVFGAAFLALAGIPSRFWAVSYPVRVYSILAALGIFPTAVAYALYQAGLRRVEASRASIVATVEPVVAALLAYLFLGELLAPIQLLGGLLVLAGVLLIQMSGSKAAVWGSAQARAVDPG